MKLILLLLITTAIVERIYFAMKIIKTQLRNRLGDDFINNCLVTYIEKDIFETLTMKISFNVFKIWNLVKDYCNQYYNFFWIFCCVRDIISLCMINFILLHFGTHWIIFLDTPLVEDAQTVGKGHKKSIDAIKEI